SEQAAQRLRVRAKTGVVASDFRSGLWIREARSFINVQQPLPDGTLNGVRIYDFDDGYELLSISYAESGVYQDNERWLLHNVVRTVFDEGRTRVEHVPQTSWASVLSP